MSPNSSNPFKIKIKIFVRYGITVAQLGFGVSQYHLISTNKHQDRGFTMVEILVVLVIFAIGATGLAAMSIQSIRANQGNKLRTKATSIIQTQIEDLRLQLKATGSIPTSGNATIDNIPLTWSAFVNQPSPGLRTVVVEVKWPHAPYQNARYLRYAAVLGAD